MHRDGQAHRRREGTTAEGSDEDHGTAQLAALGGVVRQEHPAASDCYIADNGATLCEYESISLVSFLLTLNKLTGLRQRQRHPGVLGLDRCMVFPVRVLYRDHLLLLHDECLLQ